MNRLQLFPNSAYHRLDNIALEWNSNILTYREFFEKSIRYMMILKSKGIKEGCRVIINTDIDYRFPMIFFALLELKAIVVPLNTRLKRSEINSNIKKVTGSFVIDFISSDHFSGNEEIFIISIDELDKQISSPVQQNLNLTYSIDQKATILFTSGSTGESKAVVHTIGNHYYSALGSNENIPFAPEDSWLITLPFYHISGIAILFRAMLGGGRMVIANKNIPLESQIKNKMVTHVSLVPTQLHRLLKHSFGRQITDRLKAVLVGGSSCPEQLVRRSLNSKVPIFLSYGSTEMSSQITTTRHSEDLKSIITSGYVLPYREIKISEDGEVLVKGRTLAVGYWQDRYIRPFVDETGWYHTGDLGYVDENRRLLIKGRKDYMFISAGENIYPEEIEKILVRINNIENACVVPVGDIEYGWRPVAFIKMKLKSAINEKYINEVLREHLGGIKIPIKYFEWTSANTIKPNRKNLQKLAHKLMQNH